ncbi:MAG: hypothetical protein LBL79_05405, partial [Prevotella sp.]|nr:hypothetical protein [Prevotella sp.]
MTLLDNTYFTGILELPQMKYHCGAVGVELAIQATGEYSLNYFIEKYEPGFMDKLLGKELYRNFLEGLLIVPVPVIWNDLKDVIYRKGNIYSFSPVANYVYIMASITAQTQTTTLGEMDESSGMAKSVSVYPKLEVASVDMKEQLKEVYRYLKDNWDTYKPY